MRFSVQESWPILYLLADVFQCKQAFKNYSTKESFEIKTNRDLGELQTSPKERVMQRNLSLAFQAYNISAIQSTAKIFIQTLNEFKLSRKHQYFSLLKNYRVYLVLSKICQETRNLSRILPPKLNRYSTCLRRH